MSAYTIYHNPKCSKSRQTLALLQEHGIEPQIIEYLKTPPTVKTLASLCELLQKQPQAIIRTKEKCFHELGLTITDQKSPQQWLQILADNPILIERPIVVKGNKAVIGRPPENVLTLLKSS